MGWSSGTDVCINIWQIVSRHIPAAERVEVLSQIVEVLTDEDWDCVDELEGYIDEFPEIEKVLVNYIDEEEE